MIGGQRPQLDGELRAAGSLELIRVQLDRESMAGGGGEDLTTFRCAEDSRLAEHIATLCQSLAGHRRDHLLTEQPHILGAFAAILWRHLVRAQKCRNERGGQLAGESTN